MSVSVASLGEGLVAVLASEWHAVQVNTDVVTKITKFRKLKWAMLALEDLVHAFGVGVVSVDDLVITLVFDFTLVAHRFLLILFDRLGL